MGDDFARIVVSTERLRIRPFEKTDMTPRYLSWLNDPVALRHSQQRLQKQDLESCLAYHDAVMATGGAMLAICVRDEAGDDHIGNLTLRPDIPAGTEVDISILIGESSRRGLGFATETWQAICAHLFEHCGIRRVTAGTHRDNAEMLALMKRTAMRPYDAPADFPRENVYMALESGWA
jgi:RimJ/RimL family protein N-acetyltransferase